MFHEEILNKLRNETSGDRALVLAKPPDRATIHSQPARAGPAGILRMPTNITNDELCINTIRTLAMTCVAQSRRHCMRKR